MSEDLFICNLSDLSEPGSYGFSLQRHSAKVDGFVVQKDAEYYAYVNHCPHTGAPLDWVEHQFLDRDQRLIQCAMHDALFDIKTGQCLSGPCPGQFLQKLEIEIKEDALYLKTL